MVAKRSEYLVNHGKTGTLGRFLCESPESFGRGDRVVVQGERGLSVGVVLCEATPRHARLLGGAGLGQLLRRLGPEDEVARSTLQAREQEIFETSRVVAANLQLPMEILDSELSLDGRRVILQYLLAGSCDPAELVQNIGSRFEMEVWLENLAAPVEEEHHGGCDKPDCGRTSGGGGCDSCGSGGGCTSCGSGKVDMRAYFGHLRDKMDASRTPLL
ncbi:MAG TPA: PSP1 C-terminal domain-containing protein [Gemmataceae bacterium]|nr:PSP1 C-terminal domain-containing protein [Gemmataceae bacterium]